MITQVVREEIIREVEKIVPYTQIEYQEVKLIEEKVIMNNV